jgi:hypothetical protein
MKDKILIAAVAIIGVLTVFNTYKIVSEDSTTSKSRIAANRVDRTDKAAAKTNSKADNNANPNFDPISEQDKNKPAGPKTSVAFKDMEHDFGNISQGSTNDYVFTFTNTGKEPLIITNAKGSCGCTVPRWPKEPIAPGESGEIEIIYKPGKQKNQQTKSITVTANTEPEKTVLKIKANVLEEAAG